MSSHLVITRIVVPRSAPPPPPRAPSHHAVSGVRARVARMKNRFGMMRYKRVKAMVVVDKAIVVMDKEHLGIT